MSRELSGRSVILVPVIGVTCGISAAITGSGLVGVLVAVFLIAPAVTVAVLTGMLFGRGRVAARSNRAHRTSEPTRS